MFLVRKKLSPKRASFEYFWPCAVLKQFSARVPELSDITFWALSSAPTYAVPALLKLNIRKLANSPIVYSKVELLAEYLVAKGLL